MLRLAAAGRLRLDDPASRYLGAVRLADDAVTVRELLTHTAGVTDPPGLHRPAVPAPGRGDRPGARTARGGAGPSRLSLAGYAALGEVIAGRAGEPYQDAAARLVLAPLGMRGSWFPAVLAGRTASRSPAPAGTTPPHGPP